MNPSNPSSPQMPLPPLKKNHHFAVEADVILAVLFIVAAILAATYYSKASSDTKNLNAKIATAVAVAEKTQAAILQAQYTAAANAPYQTYTGSAAYGNITFNYPKTWSAYVDTTSTSQPIEGYFYPSVVPGISGTTAFALRVELTTTTYSDVLQQYQGSITSGTLTANAYVPPKMDGVTNALPGTLLTGDISGQGTYSGTMLVIPVRNETLQIYSESSDFTSDFNNIVLASLKFAP